MSVRDTLRRQSLWKNLLEKLRVVALGNVWVTPVEKEINFVAGGRWNETPTHLTLPIRFACPEASPRSYSEKFTAARGINKGKQE